MFIYLHAGLKRKQTATSLEELEKVLERADERAAERERKMRRMELELESKMREREDQRDEGMLSMFATMMRQLLTQPPMPHTYTAPPYYGTHTQTFNGHSSDQEL